MLIFTFWLQYSPKIHLAPQATDFFLYPKDRIPCGDGTTNVVSHISSYISTAWDNLAKAGKWQVRGKEGYERNGANAEGN